MACNQRRLAAAMKRMWSLLSRDIFSGEITAPGNTELDTAIAEVKGLLADAEGPSSPSVAHRKDRLVRSDATDPSQEVGSETKDEDSEATSQVDVAGGGERSLLDPGTGGILRTGSRTGAVPDQPDRKPHRQFARPGRLRR